MVMLRVVNDGSMVYVRMKDDVNIWMYDLYIKQIKSWCIYYGLELNLSIFLDGQ